MITANEAFLMDLLANQREKLFGNLFSVFIDDENLTNFTVEIFFNRSLVYLKINTIKLNTINPEISRLFSI